MLPVAAAGYDRELIRFVPQCDDWDCGVACVAMALSPLLPTVTLQQVATALNTEVRCLTLLIQPFTKKRIFHIFALYLTFNLFGFYSTAFYPLLCPP